MSDTYQAVYDAVRSKISGGDISSVVRDVLFQSFDISYIKELAQQNIGGALQEYARPCVVFRPLISKDGDQWCVLLGKDLATGVAGFGETPSAAMLAFDHAFWKERASSILKDHDHG